MVSELETNPDDLDLPALHLLLQQAFAYMADRIDPPSSLTRMTLDDIAAKVRSEDLYLFRDGSRLVACLFGTAKSDVYYVGKLAVADSHRGQGLAKALIEAAAAHATSKGHLALELESRVELIENHAVFVAMGFERTGETAHPGYTRATSYTFRRPLPSPRSAGTL